VTNIGRFTVLASTLAATVAVACAGTALAATTITVTVTGGGKFAASSNSATLTAGSDTFTCGTATASLTIKNQTNHAGTAPLKIGTAKSFAFGNCSLAGVPATLTVISTKYQVSADSATDMAGQTDLIVGKFDIDVSTAGCSFTVTGDAPAAYDNPPTQSFGMGPIPPTPPLVPAQLTVSHVAGCGGMVMNGGTAQLTATYTLNTTGLVIEASTSSS
jgi:hypothetical protein